MKVGDANSATAAAISALTGGESVKQNVQIAMLKKVLQAQQDESTELMKMTQGKGQVIDIRV